MGIEIKFDPSRRYFLEQSIKGPLGVMFLGLLSEQSLHPEYSTELPLPENMYGVDVYGARTRLTTGQLADLYTSFDKAFDARVPPGQRNMDKWTQRRFLLPPNEIQ